MSASNTPSFEDAVCPAVKQIFETMYFCEPAYCGPARVTEPAIGSRVSFTGDLNGEFRVVVARRAAFQLTADFLGSTADEVTESLASATVSELANVTCGAAMSRWIPTASLHFSTPTGMNAEESARDYPHVFCIAGENPELAVEVEFRDIV